MVENCIKSTVFGRKNENLSLDGTVFTRLPIPDKDPKDPEGHRIVESIEFVEEDPDVQLEELHHNKKGEIITRGVTKPRDQRHPDVSAIPLSWGPKKTSPTFVYVFMYFIDVPSHQKQLTFFFRW